jgi:hypothetical protein
VVAEVRTAAVADVGENVDDILGLGRMLVEVGRGDFVVALTGDTRKTPGTDALRQVASLVSAANRPLCREAVGKGATELEMATSQHEGELPAAESTGKVQTVDSTLSVVRTFAEAHYRARKPEAMVADAGSAGYPIGVRSTVAVASRSQHSMMSARVETVLPEDSLAHHPLPKKRPSELRPSHFSMTACSRQHRREARPTSRILDLAVE